MDTVLFGVGLVVATGAFFVLIEISKVRQAIQRNVDEDVKINSEGQTKTKKNGKSQRVLLPA